MLHAYHEHMQKARPHAAFNAAFIFFLKDFCDQYLVCRVHKRRCAHNHQHARF